MKYIDRRDFIYRIATGLGALTTSWLLSACGAKAPPTSAPSPIPGETIPSTPTSPTATEAPADGSPTAAPAGARPDLAVARSGEPEQLVRRAMAAMGGMERFVSAGDDVIIKPNICVAYHTPEYAATTNPWVVAELVRLCLAAGARRVRVMDYPFGGTAEQAYARSGIEEQVRAAGGQMEVMSMVKFIPTEIPQGRDLTRCDIYEDVLSADVLIDVPIAKHHSLAQLTLAMKNLMGVIRNRPAMHHNLGQRLADLTSRVQPDLTVVDAVRMLMANGPTGGNLADVKEMDTVIVSPDIVAADSYAATLFGVQPQDLGYTRAGADMGLGRMDIENLSIEEITVDG